MLNETKEKLSRWVCRQISEQQVRFSPAQISKTLQGYKRNVMVGFSAPPRGPRREERAGLAVSHKV